MILEFLPEPIKVLYLKMKTALSMRGFLEALRELLEELEWNTEINKPFHFFSNRLNEQEKRDLKQNEESNKWLKTQFQAIQLGNWKNETLKSLVLPRLTQQIKEIQQGRANTTNFVHAKIVLLEQTAKFIAHYGEFEILKGLGVTQTISISPPLGSDPLKEPLKTKMTISPFSTEGEILKKALGKGFIKADVYPPTEKCKTNRYFIDQGMILIQWPDSIKRILSLYLIDWRTTLDISAARCLHTLHCYAAWRDWLAEELILPKQPSDKELNLFYNRLAMKQHIRILFENDDMEKTQKEVFKVLDRFLTVLIHEKIETRGKRGNKDRAEKYAYRCVKALLYSKSLEERKEFNNEMVIDMILNKVQEEDLTYNVTKTNCLEACKLFEAKHGWQKKRGVSKKSWEKKVKG